MKKPRTVVYKKFSTFSSDSLKSTDVKLLWLHNFFYSVFIQQVENNGLIDQSADGIFYGIVCGVDDE